MSHNVVAIVVTYNRIELLKSVIDSLLTQSHQLKKIIIVDNNSSDGTDKALQPLLCKNSTLTYFNTGANLGGAGGFKIGFELAENYSYDYLWLMDDDFKPNFDCLEKLLKDDPSGISQPIRFNLDNTCAELSALTYNLSNPFKLNPKGSSVRDYLSKNNYLVSEIAIKVMPFEGPLISKDAVTKIGYPDSRYFIFGDDIDYAMRANQLGIPIVCNLNAKAYRLLINNQGNDLLTWKGYFMLRNVFHIHKKYGENIWVKNKPIMLALGYALSCLFQCRFKQIKTIMHAWLDSSELRNTDAFKPGSKK